MSLVAIANACAVECERQKVGLPELGYLLSAYKYSVDVMMAGPFRKVVLVDFFAWGSYVEPTQNRHGFRRTPVTFQNGGSSAHAAEIPRLMDSLLGNIDFFYDTPPQSPEGILHEVNAITKQFLWIHPFADGNGRVGFLLFNYLMGTLDNPLPLPDYFKE